ncbi:MAG: glycosyltransferase, partial [Gammaproteobacteria bacterium]
MAAAQNVGIRWCKRQGCRYVLFLDQDSIPHPSMVKGLLQALNRLVAQGQRIAAVGPRYRDPRTGATSRFIRFGWGRTRPVPCGDIVPVDFLIASGMLVPMSTLEAVGGMDEGLAIDHVDTEWLLRARALGYRPYGVCAAWMEHQLGEGGTRWLGRVIPRHR